MNMLVESHIPEGSGMLFLTNIKFLMILGIYHAF